MIIWHAHYTKLHVKCIDQIPLFIYSEVVLSLNTSVGAYRITTTENCLISFLILQITKWIKLHCVSCSDKFIDLCQQFVHTISPMRTANNLNGPENWLLNGLGSQTKDIMDIMSHAICTGVDILSYPVLPLYTDVYNTTWFDIIYPLISLTVSLLLHAYANNYYFW